jgi:hypothetical protein
MRLAVCFIAIVLFVALTATSAVRSSVAVGTRSQTKSTGVHDNSSISATSYRSPGKLHKATIPSQDLTALTQAKASGAIEIADYGSFKLLAMDNDALQSAEELIATGARDRRDDIVGAGPALGVGPIRSHARAASLSASIASCWSSPMHVSASAARGACSSS